MAEYWAERVEQLNAQLERDEARLHAKLGKLYDSEAKRLEVEIASYYARYGVDNVVRYRQLLGSLSEADRRLLIERMDEFAEKHPDHADLLPVRRSIYKLNELEGLQTAIRMQQLEIGAIEADALDGHLKTLAGRFADAASKQLENWGAFHPYGKAAAIATVGAAWADGKNFSDRIWGNREKLAAYLNDDLGKMLARGATYDECVKALGERFANVSRRDMYRLVYTEGTFVANESQAIVFEQDYDGYAVSCADSKACDVCLRLQSEQAENPVPYAERKPGVNFPPLHPRCRCTAGPSVRDWDEWIEGYVAKRGGDYRSGPASAEGATDPGDSPSYRWKSGYSKVNGVYGEFRGLSYIDDGLGKHVGDGTRLDPIRMIMEDTGFDEDRARIALKDLESWTGTGYTRIRRKEGEYLAVALRIEEYIEAAPKYKGTVWRGIGVDREVADGILSALERGEDIDQLGIASWATEKEWGIEFASMNTERMENGVKIIFRLEENKSGVSIKHLAVSADNDEVIAPERARYVLSGGIIKKSDPYDGEYYLVEVREL